MPRRKSVGPEQLEDAVMLPVPRPSSRREHDVDPYETLPGAMPNTPVPGAATPIKRKMTKQEIADRTEAQLEQKMRGERYARYLDAMVEHMGDQELALADVYGIKVEDVRVRRLELQADVRQGIGKTQLSDVLERADLNIQSRVSLLRRHAFSNNPAASLKAIDMIQDLEGDRADHGSFESYLRLVKGKE